jgi:flagellar biogenesis protein FliO
MDWMTQGAAVAGVLALLVLTLGWLRRRGIAVGLSRRRRGPRLELVERLPLGPQHSLHLVRWGEQALLVSSAPGGCGLMATRPWREVAEAEEPQA